MECREALGAIVMNDLNLMGFLQSDEGRRVEAHVSGCRCEACLKSQEFIRNGRVRSTMHLVIGGAEEGAA